MSNDDLKESLRAYLRRRPFQPFLVEFFSGVQIRVHHPEGIAPHRQFWIYRGPGKSQSLFLSSSVCRLLDENCHRGFPRKK